MGLILREDVDLTEVAWEAVRLLRDVMDKQQINSFADFSCPYTKSLAEELYEEEELYEAAE